MCTSCTAFGIAASGQASVHSMQPVQAEASKIGTVRRNMPLSLPAAVPLGTKSPAPGITGARPTVPSRKGLPMILS